MLGLILISLLPLPQPPSVSASIDIQYVDEMGAFPDIAVNSSGIPHIAYMSRPSFNLNFSFYDGSIWESVVVDSLGNVGANPSLVFDSWDRPHISYWDIDNESLKYAVLNGSSWNVETVDSSGSVGRYSSIAVDGLDRPHIAYIDGSIAELRYAHWTGSFWTVDAIDSKAGVTNSTTIALDSNGYPHVLYYSETNESATYAKWNGSYWTYESLDFVGSTEPGGKRMMILDSLGRPHIPCKERGGGSLFLSHAYWDGEWIVERITEVDRSYDLPLYRSVSLDPMDSPHITFLQEYAYWNGRHWVLERIPDSGAAYFNSISVDSGFTAHMAYFNPISRYLVYANRNGSGLPDLLVLGSDLSISPSEPLTNGSAVNISGTLHNVGEIGVPSSKVRFTDGSPPSGSQIGIDQTVGELLPRGGRRTVVQQWIATPVGWHKICVFADPENAISESNETNNVGCLNLLVTGSGYPSSVTNVSANLAGNRSGDVVLTWTLSTDDGLGNASVSRYDILRGSVFDPNHTDYIPVASLANGTASYVDPLAGEGDSHDYFYAICAVWIENLSSCAYDQAAKFTRPLALGPNLVSSPLIQSDESIETVLQTVQYDKAWSYDSSSQEWKWYMKHKGYRRGLFEVNHIAGLWIDVTEDSNLTVAGVVPAQTTIHLYEGWNLVSFPSFNSSYTVYDLKMDTGAVCVEGYDPSPPYHLSVLEGAEVLLAGYAYWVRVAADNTWTVDIV